MPTLFQINVTSNWGSTGKITEAIGLAAERKGWECYVAYGRMHNLSQLKTLKIGNALAVCLHYVADKILDSEGRASLWPTRRLIRQIMRINPDVVHLHNIHDHYLNYSLLFGYLNKTDIKVVWTFHDCWAFTGHCYHFMECRCEKWRIECGDCPLRNKFHDRSRNNFLLKKRLFTSNNNLNIVTVSQWMSDLVKQSFFKGKHISVIHNGVNLKTFFPQIESRVDDGRFRIIAVSSVWPMAKGLGDIIRLRSLLPSEYEIKVVGLNKKQVEILPPGIIGIYRTQDMKTLAHLYSSSHVLINTSYADTFPTVNMEALACGIPVITYNTGGSPEAIDEKTGIVVPQGDIEGMAAAIRHLKEHPLSLENCRKRAEDKFDESRCYDGYVKLYTGL